MSKDLPKVSIVLPTYNGAKYIRQAIESCLNQTYKNIELVIVDDGSLDATPEIIKSFKDKRIKHLRHKKNKGLPFALNTGFRKVTGDWLTWTSDDNFYHQKAIEKMITFLEKQKCSFVYCDYYKFKKRDLSDKAIVKMPAIFIPEKGNRIGPCFLYSSKVRKTIGRYHPETALAEDFDYWVRVHKKFSLYHLTQPLYFYREHQDSLTAKKLLEIKIVEILVRLKNDILDIGETSELLISLTAQQKKRIFRFNRLLTRILLSGKIEKILRDYQVRKISFEQAKKKLLKIIPK